jgi:hypothetical protein
MARTPTLRAWIPALSALGAVYACSGNPEVIVPTGSLDTGGDGGSSANGGKGGSLSGGNSGTAGRLSVTGGTGGGKGGSGGKGGKSSGGSGGSSSGGDAGNIGSGAFGGFPDIDFEYDAGMMGQGGACDQVTGKGTLVKRPMDVIVAIDNSASMQGEIEAVQQRINADFASIIAASEIDYRVIMVSRYGNVYDQNYDGGTFVDSAYSICVGGPLSSIDCPNDENDSTPLITHTPTRFFHHSTDIGSNNLWCRLLNSFDVSDPYPADPRSTGDQNGTPWVPIAPNGWGEYLRPEAYKVFIGITDDSPSGSGSGGCENMRGTTLDGTSNQAGADAFDTVLRTMSPQHFGAVEGTRNYVWYSIVGMAGNDTNNPTPLVPTDPIETECCTYNQQDGYGSTNDCPGNGGEPGDGANNGAGYQHLSILTGGLRYPSCYNSNFDSIFNAIAQGVIEGARASCEYDVPVPDDGIVDFDQTTVTYNPAGNPANAIPLTRAQTDAACGTDPGFYFDSTFETIYLCPSTCTTVQADPEAEVAINFGCLGS